jgi:hypothetical protein
MYSSVVEGPAKRRPWYLRVLWLIIAHFYGLWWKTAVRLAQKVDGFGENGTMTTSLCICDLKSFERSGLPLQGRDCGSKHRSRMGYVQVHAHRDESHIHGGSPNGHIATEPLRQHPCHET